MVERHGLVARLAPLVAYHGIEPCNSSMSRKRVNRYTNKQWYYSSDSNRHYNGFEPFPSASWGTVACCPDICKAPLRRRRLKVSRETSKGKLEDIDDA